MSRIQLLQHPYTRAITASWYVLELGLEDVDSVEVDFTNKAHKEAEFQKISPFGRLPALKHGDLNLFETGAILTYLAEHKGDPRLATPQGRAINAAWILAANSTVSEALYHGLGGGHASDKEAASAAVLQELDAALADKDFFVGCDPFLSAADCALAGHLIYAASYLPAGLFDAAKYPRLLAWMHRMAARPACKETFGMIISMWEDKEAAAKGGGSEAQDDAAAPTDGGDAEGGEEHAAKKIKA